MLEKDIESAFQRQAKKRGWLTQKLDSGKISRGWPDRMIILPNSTVVFIEFKTKTGRVSQLQQFRMDQLKSYGQKVHLCRDWQSAVEICESYAEK